MFEVLIGIAFFVGLVGTAVALWNIFRRIGSDHQVVVRTGLARVVDRIVVEDNVQIISLDGIDEQFSVPVDRTINYGEKFTIELVPYNR